MSPPSCCQRWGVRLEQMGPQMKEAQQAQPGQPSCYLTSRVAHLPFSQGWSGTEGPCKPCRLLRVRREASGRLQREGELAGDLLPPRASRFHIHLLGSIFQDYQLRVLVTVRS